MGEALVELGAEVLGEALVEAGIDEAVEALTAPDAPGRTSGGSGPLAALAGTGQRAARVAFFCLLGLFVGSAA